jgi:predicted protein tyrosine phosphatase
MGLMNRLANCKNMYQGNYHRVLTVCSAGLLRSATIAYVLGREPYNCNVRNVGISSDYALIPIDEVHLEWAQTIICAEEEQLRFIVELAKERDIDLGPRKTYCLDLPDEFGYRDKRLVELIEEKLQALGFPLDKK